MIFNDTIVVLAADAPPVLFPAREQIACSLGWHVIPDPDGPIQLHIPRGLCCNDQHHDTEHQ
jgi:hypothetical protein